MFHITEYSNWHLTVNKTHNELFDLKNWIEGKQLWLTAIASFVWSFGCQASPEHPNFEGKENALYCEGCFNGHITSSSVLDNK